MSDTYTPTTEEVDERVRFKGSVRRRRASDDKGLEPEDRWPDQMRWVAEWDRHVCGTGEFISGCASPYETFEAALSELVEEADHVRAANARMYAQVHDEGEKQSLIINP